MLKKIPNILTVGRILIVPFFVLAFYLPGFYGDLTALILFIVASFTDFLDGMLARLLGQLKYGASVAVVGNASGTAIPANVIPFLLRGVNMLGIDSAMQPYENRVRAWNRITTDLPMEKLDGMINDAVLADLPRLGKEIQSGQIKGRVVVDVNK